MGEVAGGVGAEVAEFLGKQRVFFVATAPLAATGRVNLSPKGLDSFRVIDPRTVAYLDLTGSGIETVAHLRENGRIVLMFCAFEGPPRIVRLHGRGEALEPGAPGFDALRARFPALPGVRAVVRVAVDRVANSCGFGVPRMRFDEDRTGMQEWCAKQGPGGLRDYRARKNRAGLDGLPGLAGDA
jgi:hypothetical protein